MSTNTNQAALQAEIKRLQQENAKLTEAKRTQVSFAVSEKGACSVYGMGRFPVTLYKEQWAKLLAQSVELQQFLKDNDAKLKSKGE